jgi:hypothetical protein
VLRLRTLWGGRTLPGFLHFRKAGFFKSHLQCVRSGNQGVYEAGETIAALVYYLLIAAIFVCFGFECYLFIVISLFLLSIVLLLFYLYDELMEYIFYRFFYLFSVLVAIFSCIVTLLLRLFHHRAS